MLRFVSLNKSINLRYLVFDNLLEYWTSINLNDTNLKSYLIVACSSGQLNFLKFVHNKSTISSYSSDLFLESCKNGCYIIVLWLLETFSDVIVHTYNEHAFQSSCKNGHCEIAHWLLETFSDINVHANSDYAFRWSCSNGHYEIVRWLLETFSDNDVHANNEYAFLYGCKNGHYKIARLLLETFSDINVHAIDEYAFRYSCKYGHYEIARWLFDNYDVDIYAKSNWVFINSKIMIIDWLFDIIEVRNNDDLIIKSIFDSDNCVDRQVKLKHLCELCPEYYLEFVDDKVVGYKIFELFIKG